MTIKEFLEEVQKAFERAGIACASREAMLLACHVLSCDQIYLVTNKNEYIDEKILLAAAALVNERCKGRPLAYILGSACFYGLDITVDERVLIPRPETELMVEYALNEKVKDRVLDLCTGSGCIAAAFAENSPESEIVASDLSLKALQLAKYNCKKYTNINVIKSDLFDKIEGKFDIIISNPPYIADEDKERLQKEVKDFEPSEALFAGEKGLDIIERIIKDAGKYLNKSGLLLMEIGENQTEKIFEMFKNTGEFEKTEVKKDLAGLDRFFVARKK